MSRTIRRTSSKKKNKSGPSDLIKWYITEKTDVWEGSKGDVSSYGGCPRIEKTGKDYDKALSKFYADSHYTRGNSKGLRHSSHVITRSKNKGELIRYENNPDYEIMLQKPRCLSWDR